MTITDTINGPVYIELWTRALSANSALAGKPRYAAGTREILECWFDHRPIPDEYLIVDGGKLAGTGAHSYTAGHATAARRSPRG